MRRVEEEGVAAGHFLREGSVDPHGGRRSFAPVGDDQVGIDGAE